MPDCERPLPGSSSGHGYEHGHGHGHGCLINSGTGPSLRRAPVTCPPSVMSAVPPLFACLPPPGSDADAALEGFLRYASQAGLTLYPHQEEAILAVMSDSNVIVHTPTGSGKSLIAAAVHFKAISEGRRS